MSHLTDQALYSCANRIESAADRIAQAADRFEESARRIAHLFEPGYGGAGEALVEELKKIPENIGDVLHDIRTNLTPRTPP